MQTAWGMVVSCHSVNCGLPDGSVYFHFIYMFELNVCLSPCLFPLLPPLLFLGRCCRAYWRSTAASYQTGTQVKAKPDVPSPQNTPVSHTRMHPHSPEKWENTVSGSDQWVAMLGNGCSAGGSHLSISLRFFVFFSCTLRTSVSSERNCRLHVHSLLMSFTECYNIMTLFLVFRQKKNVFLNHCRI